jgi:L-ascorbate metabolism protein UlaG (beta-lactamase superfamily)
MQITWLGHGTFQFELPTGEVIVMDPWVQGNPSYPETHKIEKVNVMCITHGHFDHVHDAVTLAKKFTPEVVAIYEICHWLESKGVENTRPMNKGGSQKVGSLTVTMTHAVHSCGILDDGKIIYGGEAAGFVIQLQDGRSLYFAGDTNVFADMELIHELYRPELVFLPIGDLFTMSPREAALACKLLKPQKVIPMHFGTFPPLTGRPATLGEQTRGLAGVQVWELQPGRTVRW